MQQPGWRQEMWQGSARKAMALGVRVVGAQGAGVWGAGSWQLRVQACPSRLSHQHCWQAGSAGQAHRGSLHSTAGKGHCAPG